MHQLFFSLSPRGMREISVAKLISFPQLVLLQLEGSLQDGAGGEKKEGAVEF